MRTQNKMSLSVKLKYIILRRKLSKIGHYFKLKIKIQENIYFYLGDKKFPQ